MKILKYTKDLSEFLDSLTDQLGCLADSSFFYALTYTDDRLNTKAINIHKILASKRVPIYANVIIRAELLDLMLRKLITLGSIQAFDSLDKSLDSTHKNSKLFKLLKKINNQNTNCKNKKSFKIGEAQLKNLRNFFKKESPLAWEKFLKKYAGKKFYDAWQSMEKQLGLNYLKSIDIKKEVFFSSKSSWSHMVLLMGEYGLRGSDAMIFNFFTASKLPLFITGDSDFKDVASNDSLSKDRKAAVYFL